MNVLLNIMSKQEGALDRWVGVVQSLLTYQYKMRSCYAGQHDKGRVRVLVNKAIILHTQ